MVFIIAQVSDVHIGGPAAGSGERFSAAVAEINAMTRQPDLVLATGDLTHNGTDAQWSEFQERIGPLNPRWEAIAGNHDLGVDELRGHRSVDAGPLRLLLLDTSNDEFTADDAAWLDRSLSESPGPTVVVVHQPPFETGIWWMDCVGLRGSELLEEVVRRHPQTIQVLSGHVHRAIHTNWDGCSVFACPSTSVAVAGDLAPEHEPATTAEGPMIGLHAYTTSGVVSYAVPVGSAAARTSINDLDPDFVSWVRTQNADRPTRFS